MYLLGWGFSSFDLGRAFSILLATVDPETGLGTWNGASYSDAALDSLYDASLNIVTPALREDCLKLLNRVAMEEKIAVIPLHYQEQCYAVYKGRGIHFTPRLDEFIRVNDITIENG